MLRDLIRSAHCLGVSAVNNPDGILVDGITPEAVAAPVATTAAPLFARLRLVGLCTLASRVLGLLRDMAMASLFGNGPIMDAFTVAFRVPNLARMLFGEGALTAAFLPAFVRDLEQHGRESAFQLASAVLNLLALALCGFVLLAEAGLFALRVSFDLAPETALLVGLTAALLPYLIVICLAAQVSSIMHALGHFTWPALIPILLNAVWLAGLWLIVPMWSAPAEQIYVVAACVVAAGFLQLAAPLPALLRLGFRYRLGWRDSAPRVAAVARTMLPVLLGLSITQFNTLADSLMAWGFSAPLDAPPSARMPLPGSPHYPLDAGTASALYLGQRLYQFPLGVFGVALGTVLFPLLTRHAERGRFDLLRHDLTLGLRLVLCIGVPASAGLILLAEPLTSLMFRRGAFDADDARQTAAMIAAYGSGVWAYCALLIVHRGYYAVGDRTTPLRVGLLAVAANLAFNLTMIWPFGGVGLALGTAVVSSLQAALAALLIQNRIGALDWPALRATLARVAAATVVMAAACLITLQLFDPHALGQWKIWRVFAPLAASVAAYLLMARWLDLTELWLLFGHGRSIENDDDQQQ